MNFESYDCKFCKFLADLEFGQREREKKKPIQKTFRSQTNDNFKSMIFLQRECVYKNFSLQCSNSLLGDVCSFELQQIN